MKNKEEKEISFEEAITKLDTIVKELESGNCGLDDAMKKYAEGMELAHICGDKLNNATESVNKILEANGEIKDFELKNEE